MKKIFGMAVTLVLVCGMAFAGGNSDGAASGQENYPVKPVQIIVPYGPGGGTDTLIRTVMKYIDLGGQPMVAVNVEGAGGFVGTMEAANRPNDGYNLLCNASFDVMSFTFTGMTDRHLDEDLIPVCVIASDYEIVATNKQSGFKTGKDVADYAKANPGKLVWGHNGSRSVTAANTHWIAQNLGIEDKVTFVPQDGAATMKPALMGNHIQLATGAVGDFIAVINSGDVVPLMVISDERMQLMPNVLTTVESGCEPTLFVARTIWTPKGTDPARIKFLEAAFKKLSENPEFKKDLESKSINVRFIDHENAIKLVLQARDALGPRLTHLE
jgi:tripartite-type tricarboxylate transporter receptor subunit TctC